MSNQFLMPKDPKDILAIQNAVKEASNSLLRTEAERDLIKEIKSDLKEKFQMPPKYFSRLVKTYHAQNFSEQLAQDEEFSILYESLFAKKPTSPDEDGFYDEGDAE